MSDRFECVLDAYLAGTFTEKIRAVIEEAGYVEVLRIPEPHVTEFRRNNELITLQTGHPHGNKQSVAVESESVDVNPLVITAVRDTIVDVSDHLLGCIPWLDRVSIRTDIAAHLSKLVAPPQ